MTYTKTLSSLEISKAAFDEIKDRLNKQGALDQYLDNGAIILSDVALVEEETLSKQNPFPVETKEIRGHSYIVGKQYNSNDVLPTAYTTMVCWNGQKHMVVLPKTETVKVAAGHADPLCEDCYTVLASYEKDDL